MESAMASANIPAPLDTYRDHVRPEWIDHNGHMNMGYYLVVFDFATDEFFRWIGLDESHRRAARVTTFALEAHVTYHREVREGDLLRFTTLLLAHDAKRLHYLHQNSLIHRDIKGSKCVLDSLLCDCRPRSHAD